VAARWDCAEPRRAAKVLLTKETDMADDKTRTGAQDRSRVAGGRDHELRQFAETHGVSIEQVEQLITRVGNSRQALEAAVRSLGD
jgi:hypothetical protein